MVKRRESPEVVFLTFGAPFPRVSRELPFPDCRGINARSYPEVFGKSPHGVREGEVKNLLDQCDDISTRAADEAVERVVSEREIVVFTTVNGARAAISAAFRQVAVPFERVGDGDGRFDRLHVVAGIVAHDFAPRISTIRRPVHRLSQNRKSTPYAIWTL